MEGPTGGVNASVAETRRASRPLRQASQKRPGGGGGGGGGGVPPVRTDSQATWRGRADEADHRIGLKESGTGVCTYSRTALPYLDLIFLRQVVHARASTPQEEFHNVAKHDDVSSAETSLTLSSNPSGDLWPAAGRTYYRRDSLALLIDPRYFLGRVSVRDIGKEERCKFGAEVVSFTLDLRTVHQYGSTYGYTFYLFCPAFPSVLCLFYSHLSLSLSLSYCISLSDTVLRVRGQRTRDIIEIREMHSMEGGNDASCREPLPLV